MPVVGGLRTRLIVLAFHDWVEGGLNALGWFDPTIYDTPAGIREHRPVHLITRPADDVDHVETNSLAITPEDTYDDPAEMGSSLTDDRWTFSIDIYAEDDAVGLHLANDVRDILRGKMPSIGRAGEFFPVHDRTVTPIPVDPLFSCEIANVVNDRARGWPKPWQQHWFSVRCDVNDTYGDEVYG